MAYISKVRERVKAQVQLKRMAPAPSRVSLGVRRGVVGPTGRGFFHLDGRRAIIHPNKRYIKRPSGFGDVDLYDVYNEFGEYEGLLSGIRKAVKKVTKPVANIVKKVTDLPGLKQIKKVARTVKAGTLAVTTAGLVKPKALGIHSDLSKSVYRKVGTATKVVGGIIAAPIVAPMIGAGLSTVGGGLVTALGPGLKFLGGGLVKGATAVGGGAKGAVKAVGGVLFKSKAPGVPSNETGGETLFDAGRRLLKSSDFDYPAGGGGGGGAPYSVGGGEGMPPATPVQAGFLDGIPPIMIFSVLGFAAYKLLQGNKH